MNDTLAVSGWLLFGVALTGVVVMFAALRKLRATLKQQIAGNEGQTPISGLAQSHFAPTPLANITISERKFPFRVRADLQRAIDRLFNSGTTISQGVRQQFLAVTDWLEFWSSAIA
jgi:hypothetical protein